MSTGWIKIHLEELDNITKPMSAFESWFWLLCKVGYSGRERGKLLTTYGILADEWGVGKGAARWRVAQWKRDGRVTYRRVTKNQINFNVHKDPRIISTLSSASGAKAALAIEVTNYKRYRGYRQGEGKEVMPVKPEDFGVTPVSTSNVTKGREDEGSSSNTMKRGENG